MRFTVLLLRDILRLLIVVIAFSISSPTVAQENRLFQQLEGFWNGAFIRSGGVQILEVEFSIIGDSLYTAATIPDWIYYSPTESQCVVDGNVVSFDSPYGKVTAVYDSAYQELIGYCNFADVHLKRCLRPPKNACETLKEELPLDDFSMAVDITKPLGEGPFVTVIIVHGRGCGSKDSWSRRPEVLTRYGLAVVTFDKRGTKSSGIPCEGTKFNDHTRDLAELTEFISQQPFTEKIGYIGYSAGGWVAPRAAALSDGAVDFMITVVGPSTSIRQQQLDCAKYYVRDQLKLDDKSVRQAIQYTDLPYQDQTDELIFQQMSALLDSARNLGWISVLEDSDIPSSVEEVDKLWVRRNQYDPAADLSSFQGPFLSILGGSDFVVPYRENQERFNQLFNQADKSNYRIVVAPSAHHGMEHGHSNRDLGYQAQIKKWPTYWKFDRVVPGAIDEIILFLRDFELIDH